MQYTVARRVRTSEGGDRVSDGQQESNVGRGVVQEVCQVIWRAWRVRDLHLPTNLKAVQSKKTTERRKFRELIENGLGCYLRMISALKRSPGIEHQNQSSGHNLIADS